MVPSKLLPYRACSASDPARLNLVLITPARNEAEHIEKTILSVTAQRHRPDRWIIVNDGSTDDTAGIVRTQAAKHPWIELIEMPPRAERHFAGKVHAFNAAYERLKRYPFDIIGSLDADISFDEDFFEVLLLKFSDDPALGLAGAPFQETDGSKYDYRFTNSSHVSGACQLFRKACFEAIGGYRPVAGGGIDWIAATTARMCGWKTQTYVDVTCYHHRPMGTASNAVLAARFRLGRKDYRLGGHPLWQLFRGAYQMRSRPYGIGGILLIAGYYWDLLKRSPKSVDATVQRFHRDEQMKRLRDLSACRLGHRQSQA